MQHASPSVLPPYQNYRSTVSLNSNTAMQPFFKHSTGNPSSPGALRNLISFTASIDIALYFNFSITCIRQSPPTYIYIRLTDIFHIQYTCSKYSAHLLLTSTPSRNIWPFTISHPLQSRPSLAQTSLLGLPLFKTFKTNCKTLYSFFIQTRLAHASLLTQKFTFII